MTHDCAFWSPRRVAQHAACSDHRDKLCAGTQFFGICRRTEFGGATELIPSTSASGDADGAGDIQVEGLHQLREALRTREASHPAVADEGNAKGRARLQGPFGAKERHVCELLQQCGAGEVGRPLAPQ